MNITGRITVKPAAQIMQKLGVLRGGEVQKFHTRNVLRRIQKYMPYRTGLTIKLMVAQSPVEEPFVVIDAPYARYLYYGKAMVNAKTGKGPAYIPNVGYRYRRGTVLKATDRPLRYTTTKNPQAGPLWDKRLIAAEGETMRQELQDFVDRRAGMR